jgi:hypothetical protein
MALSVVAVSISVSPLVTDEVRTDMFITSAPSRLPANSNELWVRVDGSKNRLMTVRPFSRGDFFSLARPSATYSSPRSSRPVISPTERPSMPSRWLVFRIGGAALAGLIKARLIGKPGGGGKRSLVWLTSSGG